MRGVIACAWRIRGDVILVQVSVPVGSTATIYVPIASKDLSYPLSREIQSLIGQLDTVDDYHITGLPVAEDTFGHDMFVQMGISAPLAGLMIFLLMLYFFRSVQLVVAPMLVAMATVIISMGLLTGLGFTVHIMSSNTCLRRCCLRR